MAHISLARTIYIAARIRISAGNRAQIDDIATFARHHLRQHLPGQISEPDNIGVDHGEPIGKISLRSRLKPKRQTGVVDQRINLCKRLGQALQSRIHRSLIAHIHLQRIKSIAQLSLQSFKLVGAPCRTDYMITGFNKAAAHRLAKARRCPGD